MERREHEVRPEEAGRTVLRILHDACALTHSTARGLLAAGRVRRNGAAVARVDERVESGDLLRVEFDPGTKYREPPRARPGEGYGILFEDVDLVVVEKEPGVLTIAATGGDETALEDRLLASYRKRGLRKPFVKAVHRIDRYTSGVVAFARGEAAFKALREQFSARTPERTYLAVVEGRVRADEGTLRHRLEENPETLKVHTVAGRRGLDAASAYRTVERFTDATLVEVRLVTGRRNQIRVQFAAEGHPLVGDGSYGHPSALIPRSALHAWRLAFDHPADGRRLTFESVVPEDFERLVSALRKGALTRRPPRTPREKRPAPAARRPRHSATRTRTPVKVKR